MIRKYSPVVLTSLNILNSTLWQLAMFWVWRRHGDSIVTSRRGCWHNALFLKWSTANIDVAYGFTQMRLGFRNSRYGNAISPVTVSYGPYHGLELSYHGIDDMCQLLLLLVLFYILHSLSLWWHMLCTGCIYIVCNNIWLNIFFRHTQIVKSLLI